MSKSNPKRPRDTNRLAYTVVQESIQGFERRPTLAQVTVEKKDGTLCTIDSERVVRTHSSDLEYMTVTFIDANGSEKSIIAKMATLPDEILNLK